MERAIVLIPALNPLPAIVHFVEKLNMFAYETSRIIDTHITYWKSVLALFCLFESLATK